VDQQALPSLSALRWPIPTHVALNQERLMVMRTAGNPVRIRPSGQPQTMASTIRAPLGDDAAGDAAVLGSRPDAGRSSATAGSRGGCGS
jgi:hypothetical protein